MSDGDSPGGPAAIDLTNCEREPIHVPGSIQPHGALLALDADLIVRQVSANLAALVGVAVSTEAQAPPSAREILGDAAFHSLATAHAANRLDRLPPLHVSVGGHELTAVAHARFEGPAEAALGVRASGVIIELERRDAAVRLQPPAMVAALSRISSAASLSELFEAVVEEVRGLTDFDRVMVYRFDGEGAGQVIAERCDASMEPYLELHYPASDIPAQARRMYLVNWLRYIPDARFVAVPIVPELSPDTGRPLDMTRAFLRSVSPVHVEYMANMGVRASMSVSLVVRGRLWGLVSCGHREPHTLPYATRAACEVLGRLTSLQIAAHEEVAQGAQRLALQAVIARLVDGARAADDVLGGLLHDPSALLQLCDAAGVAVLTGEGWKTEGQTPPESALDATLSWLSRQGRGDVVHSARIGVEVPELQPYQRLASGVLGIVLPKPVANAVLWFRPEVLQSVRWGGNPDKPAVAEGGRLRPRSSFEQWKSTVSATSLPWAPATVEAALDLRRHATELDLERQVQREQNAVRLRNDVVAVVSHDLRNPINVIQLAAALLRRVRGATELPPREHSALSRIEVAASRMNALVHDLLDLARIEAGRFAVTTAPSEVGSLIDEAVELLIPMAERKRIQLAVDSRHHHRTVDADPERIFQVLSNLLGNALKFTPEGGHVSVSVEERPTDFVFFVRDDGPGIDALQLPRLFDRYWQARERSESSGLGLFIAKGIVEAHLGRIWVESEPGVGTTVAFSLPRA